MWDFLRDLGETNVGGAAVVKNAQDNNASFDLQSITQTRLHNVAKAYGWWISKDSVSLLVLKVRESFCD
jgi:nucleolar MIF4G domain-containing protein 1